MSLDTKFTPAAAVAKVPIGTTFLEFVDQSGCHIDVFPGRARQQARANAVCRGQEGRIAKSPYAFGKAGIVQCSFSVFASIEGVFSRNVDVTLKVNGKKFATVSGRRGQGPRVRRRLGDKFTLDVA